MLKFLLVGVIAFLIYRFWDQKPAIPPAREQEEDDPGFVDYEEID